MVRASASAWRQVLTQAGDARQRRSPGTWSALEYGCHVRDVLRLYDQRLETMLTQDGPQYPNWDQDPATVAAELAAAAEAIAVRFEAVSPAQWQRTGVRSDGAHFTVEAFARYFIHDPVHHLYDVTAVPAPGN